MDTNREIELQAFVDDYKFGVPNPGLKCDIEYLKVTPEGFEMWKQLEGKPDASIEQYVAFMKLSDAVINGEHEQVFGF